jgi:hypothetical protein
MPFAKHAGKELTAIPTPYLLWTIRAPRTLDPALRRAICQVLGERGCPAGAETKAAPLDWSVLIRQWYRGLVLDFHPDRGGSHEAMQAINEAHDRLRKLAGMG